MPIRKTEEFQILKSERWGEKSPRLILKHSQQTESIELIGGVLEAQFAVDGGYVLFITEGTPNEEALHVYLLDTELRVKDAVELSADYTPGILSDVAVLPGNKFQFSFFDKSELWSVEILNNPKTLLWCNKFPVKRTRPFLCRSWLILKRM